MGMREGVWDGDTLLWGAVEQAAWAALPAPPTVRAIVQDWAAPCDPAPLLPRERDPAALIACYRDISAARPVTRAALSLLYENAALNAQFGLWADLRREAHAILHWLAPLAASGALHCAEPAISPVRPAPPYTFPGSATAA